MIALRKLAVALILVLPKILFSQEPYSDHSVAFNSLINNNIKSEQTNHEIGSANNKGIAFLNNFTDTLNIQPAEIGAVQNQPVQPQWLKASIVPATLIVAGTITLLPKPYCLLSKYTIHDKVMELFPGFKSSLDNYMQYAPQAAVFALKAAGVRSRSDFVNQVIISAKAELLMTVITRAMKIGITSERPYGGANSMPSGHTAQAFMSAAILDMEYRDTSPWISVGGYAVATATGVYRMANNQHWISDVLIGAGIGIFSTRIVYFTHQYRWGKKSNMVLLPAIYKNGGGVSFAMQL